MGHKKDKKENAKEAKVKSPSWRYEVTDTHVRTGDKALIEFLKSKNVKLESVVRKVHNYRLEDCKKYLNL